MVTIICVSSIFESNCYWTLNLESIHNLLQILGTQHSRYGVGRGKAGEEGGDLEGGG